MTDIDTIIQRVDAKALWKFPGGIHPEDRKALSNSSPIERVSLPDLLYLPLKQHIGTEGACRVKKGQKVKKGEALTSNNSPYSVPVHAPTSGTIEDIIDHISAHPSGLREHTLVIKPDGLDEWAQLTPQKDFSTLESRQLIDIICQAGISGMGGAGFPTHLKANNQQPIEFLIINGIECEPYITSDDRLMREHPWQICQGVDILQHIIQPKFVIIAIEDNKPEALEALKIATKGKSNYRVVSVPTVYPAGGEKQLIQVLTGREVPAQGLPIDINIVMFNVGTCYAIADAVIQGKPLIERVVTVTGEGIKHPQNVWALLGTPVIHLANHAGFKASKRKTSQIIMGGPMMGFTVTSPLVPVVKITNCLLIPQHDEFKQGNQERPCIRCSACADACPASLLPQQMYWHAKAKDYEKTEEYNLFDCIECGACAYVCPSDIPLVQYYRQAKSAIRNERNEKEKSERAKVRFEARKSRLEADKREREERHKKAAEARKQAQERLNQSMNTQQTKPKSAAVAAAIARAKAKKETPQQSVVNDQSSDQKAKVAAAIARAKAKKSAQSKSDQE